MSISMTRKVISSSKSDTDSFKFNNLSTICPNLINTFGEDFRTIKSYKKDIDFKKLSKNEQLFLKHIILTFEHRIKDSINISYNNVNNDTTNNNENKNNNNNLKIEFNYDNVEPILNEANKRYTVFPIKYPKIWEMYKKQQALFWKAEEIDFSKDFDDFKKLNKDEQHFIKMVLAFFAASDGIVNFNLRERFLKDVQIMEAQIAYAWQMMMENVHSEVYSQMLENIVRNPVERDRLFNAIETVESVKAMADWSFKWINSTKSFAYRLVAFAIVEGVFFSGAFAAIFWLKRYRAKGQHFLNGLIKSNEFISRDEGQHTLYACELYDALEHKLPKEEIYTIMDEAINISNMFTNDAIPCKLIGMSSELMSQYIEFIGDRLLTQLKYPKKYFKKNPFDFMETISFTRKSNFFETRVTEYQSAHTTNSNERKIIKLDNF